LRATYDHAALVAGAGSDDLFGVLLGAADLTGDGATDLLALARGPGAGEIEVFAGPLAGQVANGSAVARVAAVAPDTYADVFWTADVNTDGQADLLVSRYFGGPETTVEVFFGPIAGDHALTDADATLYAPTVQWSLGGDVWDLDVVPDIDGDGTNELALASTTGVHLLQGPVAPGTVDVPATARTTIFVSAPNTVAVVDLDGSGLADFVIGEPSPNWWPSDGSVWLYTDPPAGVLTDADHDGELRGILAFGTYFPTEAHVEPAGDVDGDGRDDAWAAACSTYSISLVTDAHLGATSYSSDVTVRVVTPGPGDVCKPIGGRDLDGDGHADLVVSSSTDIYVLMGPMGPVVDLAQDASAHIEFPGSYSGTVGNAVAAGDMTGDDRLDLAIGAPEETLAQSNQGAVYVLAAQP
jgi:hypothetical protein